MVNKIQPIIKAYNDLNNVKWPNRLPKLKAICKQVQELSDANRAELVKVDDELLKGLVVLTKALAVAEQVDEKRQLEIDWDLIVLAVRGDMLDAKEEWAVYKLGDGFGDYSECEHELRGINDGWDWSHIRDSSPKAIKRMADKIRDILLKAK